MDKLLFDLNPNPIVIFEPDTLKIKTANKAFFSKYGYRQDKIDQLTLIDLTAEEDYDELSQIGPEFLEKGGVESEILKHISSTGEQFFVKLKTHGFIYQDERVRLAVLQDVTERVKAERKAQAAFDELNHHVNHSPLAMIKWNAYFQIVKWSKRAEEITGYPKNAVLGKNPSMFRFFRAEDRKLVQKNIKSLITGSKDKVNFETRIYRRDNSLIELRIHASVLRDANGDLISVLTFVEDITEQKKTKLRYQRLFENANDGIFIMDKVQFIDCNDEVCNIYGCNKEDILGQTPIDFSPEKQPDGSLSQEKALFHIEKALEGDPQVFEWKHLKHDGTPIDTEISLNRLELEQETYLQAIVRDLTEQKKAQMQLEKNELLFRKLFLKAPGAMIMVDVENRVKMVNQSFEDLFGYSESELYGQDIDKVIVSEDEYDNTPKMPGNDFKDGKFYKDVTRYTKEGKKLDLLLGAIPVYMDDEPIAGFGIYVDITEQKEYERKLKNSLTEKQVLLEEIHHRVKNNLAIISGLLQLQMFETEDEQIKTVLNDSQLRIQSMAIVHEMLYETESFADVSFETYLKKLVRGIKKMLPFDHHHIELKIETENVFMDLNQAIPCGLLLNELITNAYKHAFTKQEKGKIHVKLDEIDGKITLEVKDNGVGLPSNFNIEEQSSIGMNLVQTLTKQLDGDLIIKNENGGLFRVHFEKKKQQGSSALYYIT